MTTVFRALLVSYVSHIITSANNYKTLWTRLSCITCTVTDLPVKPVLKMFKCSLASVKYDRIHSPSPSYLDDKLQACVWYCTTIRRDWLQSHKNRLFAKWMLLYKAEMELRKNHTSTGVPFMKIYATWYNFCCTALNFSLLNSNSVYSARL